MSGTSAPDFTLTNVSGQSISLHDFRGREVALLFGGRDSAEEIRKIGGDLRHQRSLDELQLIAILDLGAVPKMLHSLARTLMRSNYEETLREAHIYLRETNQPIPEDALRIFAMVPDWNGKVTASFGLKGVDQRAVAVLIDAEGRVRGTATGANAAEQLLALPS